jgi:mono/diheme cytochrome c family protein
MTHGLRVGAAFLTAAVTAGVLAQGRPAGAEPTGDAERGRATFAEKGCGRCHVPGGEPGAGPALEELRRPQGAFALAGRLWNHVPAMFARLRQESLPWAQISGAEMADLMAYLLADPRRDAAADPARGQAVLVKKGCLKCHSLKGEGAGIGRDLAEPGVAYGSAASWAARMWVHTPRMAARAMEMGLFYPRFTGDEMGDLVGFLRTAAASR